MSSTTARLSIGQPTHDGAMRYTLPMTERDRLLQIIDRLGDVRVVLLGDLVLDRFILGTPKRISREAPVIILRHEGQEDIPGGGANALANLAALDVRAIPVGVVGEDEPGRALLTALSHRRIDTSHIHTVAGFNTPTKVRILGGGASSLMHQVARYDIEDSIPDTGGLRDELMISLTSALDGTAAVALSDYGYGTVRPADVIQLRSSASLAPTWICLDSRHQLGRFSGIDAATPNLQELEACAGRRLSSDADIAAAAEELRGRLGARFVLATRGNRGVSLIANGEAPRHIPVFGTDEVADVTGAGDTVLAVLTASLAAGASPHEAARLANYAGGLVVMKLGTATVSRAEIADAVSRDLEDTAR